MIDLALTKKIYFIGIGGIGMSAVAGIARTKGYEVAGSDDSGVYEPSKGVLDRAEIPYKIGYNAKNFPAGIDLVVTTSAISQDNPELKAAHAQLIPTISFAELLAVLLADKKQVLVCGTHGKGTTSGLIATALKVAEDSGFFVGGVLNTLQTNYYYGQGQHFVIEGDEYKANFNDDTAKFAYFNPTLLLINNIELDHPDLYPTLEDFKKPFIKAVQNMPEHGIVVYNADDKNVVDVVKDAKCKKIGFGFNAIDVSYHAEKPTFANSNFTIKVTGPDKTTHLFTTILPGMAYAYDVLAAVAVLSELGRTPEEIAKQVQGYTGIKRRYEIIYEDGITIIDDYAHHATAVRETLEATRQKYPNRRIICFFEPHTFSRTKETLPELEKAFGAADKVFIAEVYPAREQRLATSITGEEVVAAIKKAQPAQAENIKYVSGKGEALEQFRKTVKTGDIIIVMAVGSFNTLVYDLKDAWESVEKPIPAQ